MSKLPNFSEEELTPNVLQLLEVSHYQAKLIQSLRDEIANLKGNNPKPKIKPSQMDKGAGKSKDNNSSKNNKRAGSAKKSKTKELKIHKTQIVKAENIPVGSEFKGYKDFVVQDIVVCSQNTLYRMERWKTPSGNYTEGELPSSVNGHFGSELISYILYQHYQCHVTQPLLLEALHEFGIEISAGQISNILIEGHDEFHSEKDEVLSTGLEISSYINTDDTGARHKGKNGYCTHIGNEFFAWFESTDSKSRINFLKLLRAGHTDYVINIDALLYMIEHKLPQKELQLIESCLNQTFSADLQWQKHLGKMGISVKRHVKIATEGALIGSIIANGFNRDLVILSDDAGQFDVMLHALCWIHAERALNKLGYFSERQHQQIESKRHQIWAFYATLKEYKKQPEDYNVVDLEKRFDHIFTTPTSYISLDIVLERLYKNKGELLLVLKRPEIPLHNNSSERDIREYVKKRKISGGTRSSPGRRSRDTFTSLKKTCRKLGVSFWDYINDRVAGRDALPQLPNLMRKVAASSTY
jgi:hypothetical protein